MNLCFTTCVESTEIVMVVNECGVGFSRETEPVRCVCVRARACVCLIYYKELVHMILEADKSQDLQLAS